MPNVTSAEKLFKKNRNNRIYFERWANAHNKRDPLITKWIEHIEKKAETTRL
jgi:hypothetical protein